MARDYKRAAQKKKKSAKSVPGLVLFLSGLAIGLFAALLVYLQLKSSGEELTIESVVESVTHVVDVDDVSADKANVIEKNISQQAVKKPQKTEKSKDNQPRFDFYTILPELEVLIPEQELQQKKQQRSKPPASVEKLGTYILQAGSFKRYEQADRRKAKLALLGVTAGIQRVTINDNEVWYRVRVGPTDDLKYLGKVRVMLFKNNISAIALKVMPGNK